MPKSITETLRKINLDLKGSSFLSIVLSLVLSTSFVVYKIVSSPNLANAKVLEYESFDISNSENNLSEKGLKNNYANGYFIYASKKGKKYYYYNCKSSIKEANKIYFDSDEAAKARGYTLSKTCK